MSFEGYYQRLCKNGHAMYVDLYSGNDDDKCGVCGEGVVWQNLVDQTNGEDVGFVRIKVLKVNSCEHCGSQLETVYALPKDPGHG